VRRRRGVERDDDNDICAGFGNSVGFKYLTRSEE